MQFFIWDWDQTPQVEIQTKACQFKNNAMCFNELNNSTPFKMLSFIFQKTKIQRKL